MADFVESAKNFMSAAVNRTSWEAQKQMRLRSKQTEVETLLQQRGQLQNELAQVALQLYQKGALTDAQLSRLCSSIIELDNDVQRREAQLQDIKQEAYPADQFGPSATTNYTPPPVGGTPPNQQNPQSAPWGQPQSQNRPGGPGAGSFTPPAQPNPASQMHPCPTCGTPVRANALYCRSCGTKLR